MGQSRLAQWLGLTFQHGLGDGIAGNVLGTINVITKGVIGVTVMMWVRWTLPRLRIDQVITTCLKYCVPIAAVRSWAPHGGNTPCRIGRSSGCRAQAAVSQLAELRLKTEPKPSAATHPHTSGKRQTATVAIA